MSSRHRGRPGIAPLGAVLAQHNPAKERVATDGPTVELAAWEAAVGTRIAARARPTRLERGTLHVTVATATWCQELALMSEPIVAQLVARGLPVRSLRFRVGQVASLDRDGQNKRLSRPDGDTVCRVPRDAPIPPPVARALAKVDDEELREVLRKAAAKNLGWQAMNEEGAGGATSAPRAEPAPRAAAPRTDPSGPGSGSASSARRTRG